MEELTPELERRLQVEEAWARRIVLADVLNERRLADYGTRRMFLRFQAADFSTGPIAVPAKMPARQTESAALRRIVPTRLGPKRPDREFKAPRRVIYWTGAIAAAIAILVGSATLSGRISWPDLMAAYGPQTMEDVGPAPAEVLAKTGGALPPAAATDHAAPAAADPVEQSTLPAADTERPDLREEVRLRIQAVQQAAAGEPADQQVPATPETPHP